MSGTINTLFKITAAVVGSNALKDFSNEIAKASTNGKNLQRSLNQGAMALKAFAYSEAVQGLKSLIGESINLGAEINDVNQKTGVAVDILGRWYGAAQQAGMGLDNVAKAAIEVNKSLIASQEAGSKQAAAFAAIGIKTTDAAGRMKKAEDILFEIADAFQGTEDGAGKTAVAMALLGKSGADMIPILNKGSEEIKSLGIAVGPEFAANANLFKDNVAKIQSQFQQLSVDLANQLLPGLISISEGFEKNNTAVKLLVGLIKTLETSFVGWSTAGELAVNVIGTAFAELGVGVDALGDKIKALATLNWGAFEEINKRQQEANKAIEDEAARQREAAIARAQKQLDAIWNERLGEGSAAQAKNPLPAPNGGKPRGVIDFNPSAAADAAKALKAADEWLQKQREALVTLQQEAEYVGKTAIEIQKLKDAREFEAQVAEKARDMTKSQAEAFKAQASEIEKARQKVLQYNYDQARTFGAGAKDFFTKYAEAATDTASQVKEALTGAFNGASQALSDFVTTGKINFKSLATSIISDLIRIQIQRSIVAPIASFLGSFFPGGNSAAVTASANGNIMTSAGPLPLQKYAKGGVARTPQVSLFGEGRLPEAYVPLPDGRSIPVTMQGGGQAAIGDVNVSIVMQPGGQNQESVSGQGGRAAQFGRAVAAAVKAQIIEEQRPGGLLAQA